MKLRYIDTRSFRDDGAPFEVYVEGAEDLCGVGDTIAEAKTYLLTNLRAQRDRLDHVLKTVSLQRPLKGKIQ